MTGAVASRPTFRTAAFPLALFGVVFLGFSLPPYVGLDPATSVAVIPPWPGWYYPALVVHIAFGAVAVLTACLQVWGWLRRAHPAVHRLSGRIHVWGAVVPASLAALTIAPFIPAGANTQVAATVLALLWLGTALAGWRAARARHLAAHRTWMVRCTALTFVFVVDRLWLPVSFAVFAPEALFGGPLDVAAYDQAVGVALWLSILGNLLVAEWWLLRPRRAAPPRERVEVAEPTAPVAGS